MIFRPPPPRTDRPVPLARRLPAAGTLLLGLFVANGVGSSSSTGPDPEASTHGVPEAGYVTFVESVPLQTDLDLPQLANTSGVWLEMIRSARRRIDIETFYFSDDPDGPSPLTEIVAALEEAAGRGVTLRAVCDAGFYKEYPEIPDRLGQLPGAESRRFDVRSAWGGVQHAKCFLVDDDLFFLGSQNWDWRALAHIHEFGVRIQHRGLATRLRRILALDWAIAAGDTAVMPVPTEPSSRAPRLPVATGASVAVLETPEGQLVEATLAASPPFALPDGIPWDEPLLVALMDDASESIRLQLLSYNPVDRAGVYYQVLETGLRRAAARGVQVQILLANWAKRSYMLPYVKSLAALPNIEVRFSNIAPWSGGFIPYARVDHAKLLVADENACWVGTANWSRSYFHDSRNLSLFFRGEGAASAAIAFFARSWNSPGSETVDPCEEYKPPRIGR